MLLPSGSPTPTTSPPRSWKRSRDRGTAQPSHSPYRIPVARLPRPYAQRDDAAAPGNGHHHAQHADRIPRGLHRHVQGRGRRGTAERGRGNVGRYQAEHQDNPGKGRDMIAWIVIGSISLLTAYGTGLLVERARWNARIREDRKSVV